VVRLQVINLLPKHKHPQVLAQELDDIEGISETRAIPGEAVVGEKVKERHLKPQWSVLRCRCGGLCLPLHEALPDAISQHLQPIEDGLALLLVV
jgi:hypothetical protein